LVLQNVVGFVDFSQGRSEKADVTYNNEVSAYDAFYILMKASGTISTLPVEDSLFSKVSVKQIPEIAYEVDRNHRENDNELVLKIIAHSIKDFSSFYIDIRFNDYVIEYNSYTVDQRYSHFLSANSYENGRLKFAMAGNSVKDANGSIIELIVSLKEENSTADLFEINTIKINEISILNEEGSNKLPETFDLMQNYPNPFNPETSIKYQLPENCTVSLKIFNVLGQEVRTLINNNEKKSGYYSIKWDGRDNYGIAVSSGIYIYRIKAGNFVRSKRMVLIK